MLARNGGRGISARVLQLAPSGGEGLDYEVDRASGGEGLVELRGLLQIQVCEAAGPVSESCEVIINEDQADREGQRGQQPPMDSIISSSSLDYQPEVARPSKKPQSLGLEA